jgi:hypothetical protein
MNKEQVLGIARHILTAVGGVFVSKGTVDGSELEVIVGAVVALAGVIWSVVAKNKNKEISG